MSITVDPIAPAQPQAVLRLPLASIFPDAQQPRRRFDDDALSELALSIGANGLLQPITVRGIGKRILEGGALGETTYRIIAGERRYRASELAGLTHIDAIVRDDLSDSQVSVLQVLENLQRADLSTPDLVRGVEQLARQMPANDLAKQLGKDKTWVSRYSTVHKLWAPARALVMDELCSVDLAHDLAQLQDADPNRAQKLVEQIRTPPSYRGPITRDDVRSHLQMARQSASDAAKAKDAQAQQQVAADNQRGHESTAGDDRDATHNRQISETEAQDELARRQADADAKLRVDQQRQEQQRHSAVLEITDALEQRIEHALGIRRYQDEDDSASDEIIYRDASGKVFADFPVEVTEEPEAATSDDPADARFAILLRLALTRRQIADLATPLAAVYLADEGTATTGEDAPAHSGDGTLASALRQWLRTAVEPSPTDRIKSSWLWEQFTAAVPAHSACSNPDFGKAMKALGYEKHRLKTGWHYLGISPAQGQA